MSYGQLNLPIELAPSILTADFARLGEELNAAFVAGATRLHLDVMDGQFVPNLSVGAVALKGLQPICYRHNALIEAHLMVVQPERFIADFVAEKADIIAVHVEATTHIHRVLQMIRGFGKRACPVLNPGTPVSALEEIVDLCDQVLVMTVNPGAGGQQLIPSALDKVRRVRALLDSRGRPEVPIEVDGGINAANIGAAIKVGANIAVVGSAVFKPDTSTVGNVKNLITAIAKAR